MKRISVKIEREKLIFWGILLLGILARVAFLGTYPVGLQQDEASAGYEAWSLLTHGIDRHGLSYPVHFISWGSGQNALYSYLCIPFIRIWGLNAFSVRLPMALMGCISLPFFYYSVKQVRGKEAGLLGMFLLAVNPWHVMKSRWSIESNLFPDLVLLAVALLIGALSLEKEEKKVMRKRAALLCGAAVVLALSLYSYGTSYFFVPLFLVSVLAVLLWKKEVRVRELILPAVLFVTVAVPIFLFVIINTFDLPQIQIGRMTIPRLYVSRHTEMSAVFSNEALGTMFQNAKESVKILLKQTDAFAEHSITGIGLFYMFALPFIAIGGVVSFFSKKWTAGDWIFHLWVIFAGLMMLMVTPNITRLNICWFALLYLICVGTHWLFQKGKAFRAAIISVYLVSFAVFTGLYYTDYQEEIAEPFAYDIEGALQFCFDRGSQTIHMSSQVMGSYAYCLFYSQTDTYEFLDTVQYQEGHEDFQTIDGFGKFSMGIPEDLKDETAAYIVKNARLERMNLEGCQVKQFGEYSVVWYEGNEQTKEGTEE